jgi:hypothetical protein
MQDLKPADANLTSVVRKLDDFFDKDHDKLKVANYSSYDLQKKRQDFKEQLGYYGLKT